MQVSTKAVVLHTTRTSLIARDRARQIRRHPAPVMHQQPRTGQRPRHTARQTRPIGQATQQRQPGMRHDPLTINGHFPTPRPPSNVHPESAPQPRRDTDPRQVPSSQVRSTFCAQPHRPTADTHEKSGLPPLTTPFPHRSPRSRHRSRSMWRFEASPRRAAPKGQTSITRKAPQKRQLPTNRLLHARGTR